MNWKMTAKTTLVQLHHKIETFEQLGKHLVLALQDKLMAYMRSEPAFEHVSSARVGDAMHFHLYAIGRSEAKYRIELRDRFSTTASGVAKCLGLQGNARVDLQQILEQIQSKISRQTLVALGDVATPPIAAARRILGE